MRPLKSRTGNSGQEYELYALDSITVENNTLLTYTEHAGVMVQSSGAGTVELELSTDEDGGWVENSVV